MSSTASNRTARQSSGNPHRNHDVYIRRVNDLALQLNGDRDWSAGPASNARDALSKIRALMNDKVDPVFSSLFDNLPESGYLFEDDDLVGVVLEDLDRFSMTCEAVCNTADLGPYSDLDDRLYAMWPHALKWLSFFHPGAGRIRAPTTAPNLHLVLTNLALIYLSIFQANRGHAERLLVERPDMLHPAFDLWLYFPRYVPPIARPSGFDPVDTIHNILNAVSYIRNLVSAWDDPHMQRRARTMPISTSDARMIFVRELRRHVRGKGGLHVHFAKQNQYLTELPISPELAQDVWFVQFQLQEQILHLPTFRLDVSPRSFLRSVVSAGDYCIQRGLYMCASQAVSLILSVCEAGGSNRTLIRSIEAGAYTLLVDAGSKSGENRPVFDFSRRLSLGLAQQSVLRTFHRLHGDRYVSPEKIARDPKEVSYAQTVLYNYCYRYTLYAAVRDRGGGLAHVPCSNDTSVRGRISVARFVSVLVETYITARRSVNRRTGAGRIAKHAAQQTALGVCMRPPEVVSGVLEVLAQGKQPIVVIEAIPEYPGVRVLVRSYEGDAPLPDPTEPIRDAFVEVRITLGHIEHARVLPFTYHIAFFTSA
ncbi:hypothetical protein BD626DRAFT_619122 [Schizophyllum amplum]|uniref:Uncharacterized protein n=1 Tax=Schizophyllum amplum TaxID=97359 RepID=A0A550BVE1_9AGAR|nr:hypothetical protein BD626DRAFT_619122 [Auriculariopsis ampla]